MIEKTTDGEIVQQNLLKLNEIRAFFSDKQKFGRYLHNNADFQAFIIKNGFKETNNLIIESANEVESSLANLTSRYVMACSSFPRKSQIIIYVKKFLPFTKCSPDHLFENKPEMRCEREAYALSESASLGIEEVLIPPLISLDKELCILITQGIEAKLDKTIAAHRIYLDTAFATMIGNILARIHSRTYRKSEMIPESDIRFVDSVLKFRGTAIREAISKDHILKELWLEFLENTHSNRCCRIHNDLIVRNMLLVDNSKLLLTDWEFSAYGDPASDIGFLLGHYALEMILKPEKRRQIQRAIAALWYTYKRSLPQFLANEVMILETRIVKYVAIALFYRSWFEPAWPLPNSQIRRNIYECAYSIFVRASSLEEIGSCLPESIESEPES